MVVIRMCRPHVGGMWLMHCKHYRTFTGPGGGQAALGQAQRVIFVQHLSENRAVPLCERSLFIACGAACTNLIASDGGGLPRSPCPVCSLMKRQAPQLQVKRRIITGIKGTFPGAGALSRNPPKRKANWRLR